MMSDKIINLAKNLIKINTDSRNKNLLNEAIKRIFVELKDTKYKEFSKKGYPSFIFYNRYSSKFKIILNGHIDIIPGKQFQLKPLEKNNKLYGLGALDMKGSLATLVYVFKELSKKIDYPLALQIVTDEEIGGFYGTKYQIDKGVRADFVIVGESTNLNIENKTKGILWAKISVKGKAAHGAYPWKGENAIWKMKQFLNFLEKKYPLLKKEKWATTFNLSKIMVSNETFNKIPDDCEIWLDVRYVPEESNTIVDKIKKLLPQGFKLDIILKEPAHSTDENNQYLRLLKRTAEQITKKEVYILAAHGSSDLRHFSRVNCAGVEFGPTGEGMGSDNEWVNIKSLGDYYQILKTFLLSI